MPTFSLQIGKHFNAKISDFVSFSHTHHLQLTTPTILQLTPPTFLTRDSLRPRLAASSTLRCVRSALLLRCTWPRRQWRNLSSLQLLISTHLVSSRGGREGRRKGRRGGGRIRCWVKWFKWKYMSSFLYLPYLLPPTSSLSSHQVSLCGRWPQVRSHLPQSCSSCLPWCW